MYSVQQSVRPVCVAFCLAFCAGAVAKEPFSVTGITAPHRQATLAALQPGRIDRIAIAEGGRVRAGEVVIVLDDRTQRVRTELFGREADSTLEIDLAKAWMVLADAELERIKGLSGQSFASSKEFNDAVATAKARRLEFRTAVFDHEQAARQFEREQLNLDELHIRAPFDGVVVEHLMHEGEVAEEHDGVLTMVQLDPLEAWVNCPVESLSAMKAGDRVRIEPALAHLSERWGRIILVSPVADAGSQTIRVKVLVENADGKWIAGMKVRVRFEGGKRDDLERVAALDGSGDGQDDH